MNRSRWTPLAGAGKWRYFGFAGAIIAVALLIAFTSSAASGYFNRSDPVLIAAGDIADCKTIGAKVTGRLVERTPGTVATLGDNAYPGGSAEEFAKCYDTTWGSFKDRTRPAAGNHEYGTKGAQAYFDYFGAAAGKPGQGYYSYDLGTWHIVVLNSDCNYIGGCGGVRHRNSGSKAIWRLIPPSARLPIGIILCSAVPAAIHGI